jgi:hypothetical protein
MTFPWADQTESDFQHEQDAAAKAAHLKLVHSAIIGGEEASDSEIQRLAIDYAACEDACNLILARYAKTSEKFYDPSKRVRDLLCGLIGVTGGLPITSRSRTMSWLPGWVALPRRSRTRATSSGHGPTTGSSSASRTITASLLSRAGKSHPHSYKVRLTLMSAAVVADNRAGMDIKEAARIEADSVAGFVNRPPKRKRKATDSEMVVREVEAAANSVMRAANRQGLARNVDTEKYQQARARLAEMLSVLDEAYGFHPETSTQKKEEEQSETVGGEKPVEPVLEPRVEAPAEQVESPQVENFSTYFDSTESTTYVFEESGTADFPDLSEWVWIEGGQVCQRLPPPGNDALDDAILAEAERLRSGLKAWDSVEGRLGGEVSDATG